MDIGAVIGLILISTFVLLLGVVVGAVAATSGNHSKNTSVEFYDEGTLLKAKQAILQATNSTVETDSVIVELQNAGILFRERPKA